MWDGLLEALMMALEWSVCIQMLSGLLFFFFYAQASSYPVPYT